MTHPWSSDPARDAAVRAAEDAAAKERTPLPDHRELPERVARLEAVVAQIRAESETQQTHPACQTHSTPSEVSAVEWMPVETGLRTERVTLEVTTDDPAVDPSAWEWERVLRRFRLLKGDESVRVVPPSDADAEIERLRRDRDEALARVGNVKMERDGAKKRVAELEARVAELEAVVTKSHPANAATDETSRGGEAVAWAMGDELVEALRVLARDIVCEDGVATAVIEQAAAEIKRLRDAAFTLLIELVHHAIVGRLMGREGARLLEHGVDEGRLAVVDVGNDGDVAHVGADGRALGRHGEPLNRQMGISTV